MSATNNRNRKMQARELNLITNAKMADDAIGNAELDSLQSKTLLYEWERDSGVNDTVATHTLPGKGGASPSSIPDNAVITNVTVEVVTALGTASGTATITLGLSGGPTDADGLMTSVNHSAAPFNAANSVTSGTPVVASGKTTAACAVTMTIGTAALNAGKFYVWVTYFEGA